MSRRSDQFNRRMLSTDYVSAKWERERRHHDRGDGGKGARQIIELIDYDRRRDELAEEADAVMFVMWFITFIVNRKLQRYADVLFAIYRNRDNHLRSIVELAALWGKNYEAARRTYYNHKQKIMVFFGFKPNNQRG